MVSILLDGQIVTARESALEAFAPYFPPYYGRNLDALWDCLSEFGEEMEIRLVNREMLKANLGPFWESFARVLRDAEAECPLISVVWEDT